METLGACGEAGPETGERDGVAYLRAGAQVIRNLDFVGSPLSNRERRLEMMARMGIDHQVLSPMPMFYFYDQPASAAVTFARLHNEQMAAFVAEAPDRFSGLATLPMQAPDAAERELRRAVEELGLCGAQIGQGAPGLPLSATENEGLWQALEDLAVPVVIHPEPLAGRSGGGEAGTGGRWDLDMVAGLPGLEFRVIAELVFSGILDRHPGLNVVVPHGGGSAPLNEGRLAMALDRRPWGKGLLTRPLSDLLAQVHFDCLVPGEAALRFLVATAGADRVLLGSNAAAWDQEDDVVDRVRSLKLEPAALHRILHANAVRLFGVPVPADPIPA